jgi:hypothetical protein
MCRIEGRFVVFDELAASRTTNVPRGESFVVRDDHAASRPTKRAA